MAIWSWAGVLISGWARDVGVLTFPAWPGNLGPHSVPLLTFSEWRCSGRVVLVWLDDSQWCGFSLGVALLCGSSAARVPADTRAFDSKVLMITKGILHHGSWHVDLDVKSCWLLVGHGRRQLHASFHHLVPSRVDSAHPHSPHSPHHGKSLFGHQALLHAGTAEHGSCVKCMSGVKCTTRRLTGSFTKCDSPSTVSSFCV